MIGAESQLGKICIFFSKNTCEETRAAICNEIEWVSEQRNNKYLELPMVIGRSKKQVQFY